MKRAHAIAFTLVVFLVSLAAPCLAAPVEIPQRAAQYRASLTRAAHYYWGLDAPVATFAAQIHTESRFKTDAVSHAGARGIAQFMPGTSRWISGVYAHLKENEPSNPEWGIRALVTYDRYLFDRVNGADYCQRMAKALASYNGGLGWLRRDEKLAAADGKDAGYLFGVVENYNAGRSASAKRENRNYPRVILLEVQPAYEKAGWGQGVLCE